MDLGEGDDELSTHDAQNDGQRSMDLGEEHDELSTDDAQNDDQRSIDLGEGDDESLMDDAQNDDQQNMDREEEDDQLSTDGAEVSDESENEGSTIELAAQTRPNHSASFRLLTAPQGMLPPPPPIPATFRPQRRAAAEGQRSRLSKLSMYSAAFEQLDDDDENESQAGAATLARRFTLVEDKNEDSASYAPSSQIE